MTAALGPTSPLSSNRRLCPTIPVIALTTLLGAPILAEARVVRIEISRVESPTFGGMSFGDVGPYEKLVGRVFSEIDPEAPGDAVISDIHLAPRNARGMVEYLADLLILRPVDPSRGNGRIFFEVNNRGPVAVVGAAERRTFGWKRSNGRRGCRQRVSHAAGLHVRLERLGCDGAG